MIETKKVEERVLLLGVHAGADTEGDLEELGELVRTAGAAVLGQVVQNRESIHPGTYFGKGKIEEVREEIFDTGANGVVCDDELSPAQLKNLENLLQVKVMDRTMVILDIFAARARSAEGKIQVELAQLRFLSTRLVGMRSSLSRLGGGIGTRGPGEKKIEIDRRLIHERISILKGELKKVESHRRLLRKSREGVFSIAIVGYTNAGKTTLLNRCTQAGQLAEDALFATLDATTRQFVLPGGTQVLLTDTVGFIRKLPHHLIEAFRSTLEEARHADLLLHVVDASQPGADLRMGIVYETLRQLEVMDKDILTLFNKADKGEKEIFLPRDPHALGCFRISAKTGAGMEKLMEKIEEILKSKRVYIERIFSYQEAGKLALIRKQGELMEEEYTPAGIAVKAYIPLALAGRL